MNLNQTTGLPTQEHNTIIDNEGTTYTLEFKPLAWGLSNLEKATFLIKNFRSNGNLTSYDDEKDRFEVLAQTNMSYTVAKERFKDLNSPYWNYPPSKVNSDNWPISGHRSFWAVSPTYFTGGVYPSYADQITGTPAVTPSLDYLNFDDIYNTKNKTKGAWGNDITLTGNSLYTLENTMRAEVVTNQGKRGMTCALVVGEYRIKKSDGSYLYGKDTPPQNFYVGHNGTTPVLYVNDEVMKMAFLNQNTTILKEVPGNDTDEDPNNNTTYTPVKIEEQTDPALKYFEIYHPERSVTEVYTPNRFVSLKLSDDILEATEGYYYVSNGTTKKIASASDLTEVNKILYEHLQIALGGIEMYNSGYAYFSVPIKHLWKNTKDNKEIELGDAGFTAKLGQYGIVRNHSYTINVTGIDGIGTAIKDPNVPIIPNVEKEKYYVRTEMRVQRWRIVPVQNVTLKP